MTVTLTIRQADPDDHGRVMAVVDEWWGGRRMQEMLPRLFFQHFRETTFVVEYGGELVGFLSGFLSQSAPEEAYIHFVGVHPEHRSSGIARRLYQRFFEAARADGRRVVRCVTSPGNLGSIGFHRQLGFTIESESRNYDGPGEDRVVFCKAL